MKTCRMRFHCRISDAPPTLLPFVITIEVDDDADMAHVWDLGEIMAKGMGVSFAYIED